MKVIQLTLRTPGIFLGVPDPEQGVETPVLTLKIKQEEDTWVTVDRVPEIKVLADGELPDREHYATGNLHTQSIEVPLQGEGIGEYNLLVPDNRTWEYRIEATPCMECVDVYRTYHMEDQITGSIGVIVASGSFSS